MNETEKNKSGLGSDNASNGAAENKNSSQKQEGFMSELIKFSFWAIIIVLPIRLYVATPFIVNGESMYPTFHSRDYIIVDQVSYKIDKPQRGDVVIFKYPLDTNKDFIKRIIGLPNETIRITKNQVIITNSEHPEGFVLNEPYLVSENDNADLIKKLGPEEYFVMGDNRPVSSDSRIWGTVNEKYIIGKAFVRLYPFQSLDIWPGQSH